MSQAPRGLQVLAYHWQTLSTRANEANIYVKSQLSDGIGENVLLKLYVALYEQRVTRAERMRSSSLRVPFSPWSFSCSASLYFPMHARPFVPTLKFFCRGGLFPRGYDITGPYIEFSWIRTIAGLQLFPQCLFKTMSLLKLLQLRSAQRTCLVEDNTLAASTSFAAVAKLGAHLWHSNWWEHVCIFIYRSTYLKAIAISY